MLDAKLAKTREASALRCARHARLLATDPDGGSAARRGGRRSLSAGGRRWRRRATAPRGDAARRGRPQRRSRGRGVVRRRPRAHAARARRRRSSRRVPSRSADELRRRMEQDLVRGSREGRRERRLRATSTSRRTGRPRASVVRLLKDRLVERLVASAQALAETRRPGRRGAARTRGEAPARRREDAGARRDPGRRRRRTCSSRRSTTRPAAAVDGGRLARALRERIALDADGRRSPRAAMDDSPAAQAAHPTLCVSRAACSRRATSEGRVGRETEERPLPERHAAKAQSRVRARSARLEDAIANPARRTGSRRTPSPGSTPCARCRSSRTRARRVWPTSSSSRGSRPRRPAPTRPTGGPAGPRRRVRARQQMLVARGRSTSRCARSTR